MRGQPDNSLGIVIVDHGSRLDQSNRMLEELAIQFAKRFADRYAIVEPAHMELAEPSIATAFGKCVERGARHVIICPFFLGPGKHWTHDIPRLAADAAASHPGVQFNVAPTLGIDDLMLDLLDKRIGQCLNSGRECDPCAGTPRSGQM
jgi:sirohydrochlorin ferrochelatase